MATDTSPQRAYRAACPNCGAPVEFRSAASAFAVCSFCHSTIVREGDALRKIGESADLFDDHTPLQLGAGGKYQGAAFTLIGRLQYRYKDGTWNEWHALFDSGRSGWLSEDNGRYVIAFDVPLDGPPPVSTELRTGAQQIVNGQPWSVGSVTAARLIAAQGELPAKPNTERGFMVADLRSTRDEVGTLDYSDAAHPTWSVGRSVALSEMAMTGLAEGADGSLSIKAMTARSLACPNCGAALEVKLATTQSIVCQQCHSVVDVSTGVGADLAHYAQDNGGNSGSEPLIPLGKNGSLTLGAKALRWQVVGYVERCEVDAEEQSFWREYLLYHRMEGFAFLIDAEDGWSWSAPITGVPSATAAKLSYQGDTYRKLYSYTGKISYVLGEFYWQLTRDQLTQNTDYVGTASAQKKRLNREQTGDEVVWSAGESLPADVVAKAFQLSPAVFKRDSTPTSGGSAALLGKIFLWLFLIILVLMIFRCASSNDCDSVRSAYGESSQEYRNCRSSARSGGYYSGSSTSGGSYGGYSSGGSHK